MTKKKTLASKNKPKNPPAKKPTKSLNKITKSFPKEVKKTLSKKRPTPKTKAPVAKVSSKKRPTLKKAMQKIVPTEKAVQTSKPKALLENRGVLRQTFIKQPAKKKSHPPSSFLAKQKVRLLQLKDTLLDSMQGVARDNLHAGSQTSGFGMHQADAGSDAYDRDFALSILSQEQNSLYEIDEALKRIDDDTYGVCEISNKQIPRARLEARPFTRYTVECQAEIEKRQHVVGTRLPVSALFGLTEEENENDDDENLLEPTKD